MLKRETGNYRLDIFLLFTDDLKAALRRSWDITRLFETLRFQVDVVTPSA